MGRWPYGGGLCCYRLTRAATAAGAVVGVIQCRKPARCGQDRPVRCAARKLKVLAGPMSFQESLAAVLLSRLCLFVSLGTGRARGCSGRVLTLTIHTIGFAPGRCCYSCLDGKGRATCGTRYRYCLFEAHISLVADRAVVGCLSVCAGDGDKVASRRGCGAHCVKSGVLDWY